MVARKVNEILYANSAVNSTVYTLVVYEAEAAMTIAHLPPMAAHWRRLVKNIEWANQNIGRQKLVKSDKCMGISQLLGARVRAAL